jgi:hypothetical protein
MSEPQQPAIAWAPAWADLQERTSESFGPAVLVAADHDNGPEYIAAWPGQDTGDLAALAAAQPGTRLTLVGDEPEGMAGFANSHGLERVQDRTLLRAATADLDRTPALPDEAQVAEAPMATYDVVEVSLFDRPVGRGRIRLRDGFAVVRLTEAPEGQSPELFKAAIFAAMAEEAFLHGAENLIMVVDSGQAGPYENSGWKAVAHVLSFEMH